MTTSNVIPAKAGIHTTIAVPILGRWFVVQGSWISTHCGVAHDPEPRPSVLGDEEPAALYIDLATIRKRKLRLSP
jgi:hypothetical protein